MLSTLRWFDYRRIARWQAGRLKYRSGPDDAFVGVPRLEALEELMDLANYADEWRRQGCSWWRWAVLRGMAAVGAIICHD